MNDAPTEPGVELQRAADAPTELGPPHWFIVMAIPDTVKRSLLNANERTHWRRRSELSREWRERTCWLAKAVGIPRLQRASVVIYIAFGDKRRRDVGNYQPTAKAIVDGLVDAGVLPDDDDTHLVGPDLRCAPGPRGIRVTITKLSPSSEYLKENP